MHETPARGEGQGGREPVGSYTVILRQRGACSR